MGLVDLEEIFLTHYHAGPLPRAPGHAEDVRARGREVPLTIYGPRGLEELFVTLGGSSGVSRTPSSSVELEPGARLERDGYVVDCFAVDHRVHAIGYRLVEDERPGRFDVEEAEPAGRSGRSRARPAAARRESVTLRDGRVVTAGGRPRRRARGRTVVLTGDTAPAASVVEAATGADLLVHEATFLADERDRARETRHSTAGEAALVAREAGVKLLALTHVSTRYFGHQVVEEATQLFPATVVPRDFDLVTIPFPERGEPELVRRARGRIRPSGRTRCASSRRARRTRARRRTGLEPSASTGARTCRSPHGLGRDRALGQQLAVQPDPGRGALLAEERQLQLARSASEHLDPRRLAAVQVAVRLQPSHPLEDADRRLDVPERHPGLRARRHRRHLLAGDEHVRRRDDLRCVDRASVPVHEHAVVAQTHDLAGGTTPGDSAVAGARRS